MSAGFVAVLVGYTSAAAIIFQAAHNLGLEDGAIASWFWALGIGMAATTIGLSLYYKTPVVIVWSTPGAALLVTGVEGLTVGQAAGVFLASSLMILITGLTGAFDKIMSFIPGPLAAAMLAGILLQFGLQVFAQLTDHTLLVGAMLAAYFVVKPLLARYAIPIALLVGLVVASVLGQTQLGEISWQMAKPVWVTPEFSLSALIGVAIPLYLVTMASQNLPGLAVLRAHGYSVPASPIVSVTGATGLLMAPFGGFAYNLAAITAAICMGEDADPDPKQRYWAAVWAGLFTAVAGVFAASVVALFLALPTALVAAIAGLALLATIGNSLTSALGDEASKEAATITFLVTASGVTLFGINSAFWGLVAGLLVTHWWQRRATA
ncbi:benzoate/H(+) symporter BenE family transporter [Halioxenophilus aromaticivorans]